MSTVFQAFKQQADTSDAALLTAIVGESKCMREVLRQVEIVARTDSTVLILGETGTGKELVAQAIHARSRRRDAPLVALNCAGFPAPLLESELFGHERGAFTGAHARRIGRVELAGTGSLFLDEIGEMPLELQPRLLRLLQERTFERLGSCRTLHSDARVIAATNRDLGSMSRLRIFREDLYYRLNVFPIQLPPLRERRDDIPLLTRHFVAQLAQRMNRGALSISDATMAALIGHDWPGNVRELQNVAERSVILSSGSKLELALPAAPALGRVLTLRAADAGSLADCMRAHICEALRTSRGVIAGPKGAAARLGLKRSTLLYRMKKLGIPRAAECRHCAGNSDRSEGAQVGAWSETDCDSVA